MDIIKDIENNILKDVSDEYIKNVNKEILARSYNNSLPLLIKSNEKMIKLNDDRDFNEIYFYFRIHPLIVKIFLLVFTMISIFKNKYIITSCIIIIIYTFSNYIFDLCTYPHEIDPKQLFIFPNNSQLKWLKIYDVEIKNNTREKDILYHINCKNEQLKKIIIGMTNN